MFFVHSQMAQSALAKSPIGVTLYWDNGPQPNIVLEKWFETVKLAITAKENIQLEKLLRPKRQSRKLDYPHEPMYESPTSDETTAEKRQREQSNIKGKVDWQNQCLAIEDKGPYVDNIIWDEADKKQKASSTCLWDRRLQTSSTKGSPTQRCQNTTKHWKNSTQE